MVDPAATTHRPRLLWIDWLKVIVILGVLAYHAAQPFVLTDWLVQDSESSIALSALAGIGYLFGMPLMFLLSGAASWFALGRRSVRGYMGLRVLRLAVPLLLGLAILSPFQAWIGASTRGEVEPLPAFAVQYFAEMEFPLSPTWLGDYGYHLWFLGFLLIYVVLGLPIIGWLREQAGRQFAARIATLMEARGGILLPLAPLIASQLLLRPFFPEYRDWADFGLWLVYFAAGILFVAEPRTVAVVARRGAWLLAPGVLLALAYVPIGVSGALWQLEGTPGLDAGRIGYIILRTSLGWCLVAGSMAIAMRWFNGGARFATPASRLVLPFYVLHHPIVVIVAAAVVSWPLGLWPKYAVISIGGLVLTVALCWLAAQVPVLRGALGLSGPRLAAPASGTSG